MHVSSYTCNPRNGLTFNPDYAYRKLFSDDINIHCPIDSSQISTDCIEALTYKPCMHLGITYAHAYDFMTEEELKLKMEYEKIEF